MSSPNLPPIPPIPHFPPLPSSEPPAQKTRWWLWGLLGCAGLIVGLVILGLIAALVVPALMKARTAGNQPAYQGQTATPAEQPAPSEATGRQEAPPAGSASPEQQGQAPEPRPAPAPNEQPTLPPPGGKAPASTTPSQPPSQAAGAEPTAAPGWLPAYPRARNLTLIGGTPESGWQTGGLSYSTADTEDAVIRFYRERLSALGMTGEETYDESSRNRAYTAQNSDGSRYVSISATRVGSATIVGIGYRSKN